MGYPLGKAPVKIGEVPTPETMPVFQGTEPVDMQRVIWSLFEANEPLIVRGCQVTGAASMEYKVSPGVVYIPNGAGRGILVPIDAATISADPAPSSGSRTDHIYADATGSVKVGSYLPSGAVELDRRRVSAGVTSTSSAPGVADRRYATLAGAARGLVYSWVDPTGLRANWDGAYKTRCRTTITCDTDRHVDFRLTQSMGSNDHGSAMWEIWIDGKRWQSREFEVTLRWDSRFSACTAHLTAGTHDIELRAKKETGSKPFIYGGGGNAKQPGNRFEVVDLGAAR